MSFLKTCTASRVGLSRLATIVSLCVTGLRTYNQEYGTEPSSGMRPKTVAFEETYDIFYPPSTSNSAPSANVLSSKAVNGPDSTTIQKILFGFTDSVRFSYEINHQSALVVSQCGRGQAIPMVGTQGLGYLSK